MRNRAAFLALLSAVAAFSVLQSMVLPALPVIRNDLHASVTASSWVLSSFLLASSIAAVTLGRLGDTFGKKRLLVVSMGALLLGSIGAAVSPSIEALVASRALQGVGAAAFPLAYGLVREIFPADRVPAVVGAVSSTFGVGFAVGLILPAPLLAAAGWHAIFWLSAAVDVVALALIIVVIPESRKRSSAQVDRRGALLLTVALSCLLLAISEARAWPPAQVALVAALGALTLVLFVLLELRSVDPLVQPRLLAIPAVAAADTAGLLVGFALFGAFSIIPEFVSAPAELGYGFGATSLQAGLLLLPTAVVMVAVGPTAGRLGARFGHARTLAAAALSGVAGYAVLVVAIHSIWAVLTCTTVLGVAVGLALTAMVNLVLESVSRADTGQATAVNTISRTVGGAVGAQVTAALVSSGAGYRIAFVACGASLALAAVAAASAHRYSGVAQPSGIVMV